MGSEKTASQFHFLCPKMFTSVSSKDIQKARQTAKRSRTSVACLRCKAAKMKCSDYRPCKQCTNVKISCEEAQVRKQTKLFEVVPYGGCSVLRSDHQATCYQKSELGRDRRQDRFATETMTLVALSSFVAPMKPEAARSEYPGLGIREAQQFSNHAMQNQSPTELRPDRLQFAVTANLTIEQESIQRPALGSISQMLPTTIAERLCIATPVAANSIYQPNSLLRSIHLPVPIGISQLLPPILAAEAVPPSPPAILPSVAAILHSASLPAPMQPDARRQLIGRPQPFFPPPPSCF